MNSFVEVLDKSANTLLLGWRPEATTGISGYNVYVGQVPIAESMKLIAENVAPQLSNEPGSYKKVTASISASAVATALGLSVTSNFSNLLLYFTITYIDMSLTESSIGDSIIVEVPPVGVMIKTMKEDPTANRHIYGFSEELQKWIKAMSSSSGALITDACNLYRANTITEYTRDASGNVLTEKVYFSDRTAAGSPAKLITYDYTGLYVGRVSIVDSTV